MPAGEPEMPVAGPAHPERPDLPRRAGRSPHSPIGTVPEADAARYARSDLVILALERVKAKLGVPLESRLPAYRNRFEHPGCPACDHGFLETADGRAAPCPACRAAGRRAGHTPG